MKMFDKLVIPMIIFVIIFFATTEKKKCFDFFIEGANEGLKTVLELFPILLALLLSVSMLRASGIISFMSDIFGGVLELMFIPREITSLIFLKPISGSSSLVLVTDIMKQYGPDSFIGLVSSTILGATETTLYAITVYTGAIKKKISKKLIILAVFGNFIAIFLSAIICKIIFL